jgi:hypothetical protein
MKPLQSVIVQVITAFLGLAWLVSSAGSAEPAPPATSARDLAAGLAALQQDGASYVRLRLQIKQPGDTVREALQLQIKGRRTKTATDLVYQVLWPKERKGESVLLHQTDGHSPAGSLFIPPDKLHPLNASQMNGALFGSDLSYQDAVENFFAWENQAVAGTEVVNGVSCTILESRLGQGESSPYARVRSWIDLRRRVPLRVEKYLPSGQLARRIETTRVVTDDKGRSIPAELTVRGLQGESLTTLDGSRIRHDVAYSDREFTPEGLPEISTPRSAPE